MLTLDGIREKLLRRYPDWLRAWLNDDSVFPLVIPVGRLPDDFAGLRESLAELETASQRYGFHIETQRRRSRKWGEQDFPLAIHINTPYTLLTLIGKREEFQRFQDDAVSIRAALPALESWIRQYPERVIEYHGEWAGLLEVCRFFVENPQPDRFMRELPISPHSKFIETHKPVLRSLLDHLLPEAINPEHSDFAARFGLRVDEPLLRLRLLDQQLERRYGLAIHDLSLPVSQLAALDLRDQIGIIVENKTPFLTLPVLPQAFAIFGSGFDANSLKAIEWLKHCRLLYWGDLDAQGFEILAMARRALPQLESIMMDQATFDTFKMFAVPGTPASPIQLVELTPSEWALCQHLTDLSLRLEQERIQLEYAHARLRARCG